jgi:uncharacterized 2Fe-2S/4Fe-4S cluster protein (DUF4445 family)
VAEPAAGAGTAAGAATFEVDFEPAGRRVRVERGTPLLDAARSAGIGLASVCGGDGTCGRCRVVVMEGELVSPTDADRRALSRREIAAGERLACKVPVASDIKVHVPKASLITDQRLQVLGPHRTIAVDPAVRALAVQAEAPSLHDARSDFDRVIAAATVTHGVRRLHADPVVLSQLTPLLRRTGWAVTLLVRGSDVVGVLEPGRHHVGLAVDLGTTKVAGYLIDLESGEELAAEGMMNPQIAYGEDVISRLAYAVRHPGGDVELAGVVRRGIDELVGSMCATAGIERDQVAEGCIVGNTAMHHLLLGLPTRQLAQAPFVAATSVPLDVRARDLGIAIAPDARIHVPPNIGGFVGADHTAMILGADLDRVDAVKLGVDIGTNTEIVLRRPSMDHLVCTSCASGPAFEGAHIRDGMRAATGAIEGVVMFDDDRLPEIRTIGDAPAVGICGSGIVDAVSELYRTGRIDHRGRLQRGAPGVVEGERGLEVVLAAAETNGIGRAVSITQGDVNEIQLAKGAIEVGISILLAATDTPPESVDEVVVAGAFGSYLDLDSALDIGLLPRLPNAAYVQVGNAAGTGAKATLLSLRERARARDIAHEAEYLELTTFPGFQTRFARSMLFPRSEPRGS